MHELSIALSVLDLAAEEARQRQIRILAVHLRVGPLAGVVPEALRSAFELAREGTELAECRLVVEETQITLYCSQCASSRCADSLHSLRCTECGSPGTEVTGGRELELCALEVEA